MEQVKALLDKSDLQFLIISKTPSPRNPRRLMVGFGLFEELHYEVIRATSHGVLLQSEETRDIMELSWPDFWEEVGDNTITKFSIYTESRLP